MPVILFFWKCTQCPRVAFLFLFWSITFKIFDVFSWNFIWALDMRPSRCVSFYFLKNFHNVLVVAFLFLLWSITFKLLDGLSWNFIWTLGMRPRRCLYFFYFENFNNVLMVAFFLSWHVFGWKISGARPKVQCLYKKSIILYRRWMGSKSCLTQLAVAFRQDQHC